MLSLRLVQITLLSLSFLIHLYRFPHLILENGGGAFFILYFLALHWVAFPLLVAEQVLFQKLSRNSIHEIAFLNRKGPAYRHLTSTVHWLFFFLRTLLLFFLGLFFLYIGAISVQYMLYFASFALGWSQNIINDLSFPEMGLSLWGSSIWVLVVFALIRFWSRPWSLIFTRVLLPIGFGLLLFLFLRVIIATQSYEGFKLLLYPDFSNLTVRSLLSAISHALISVWVGVGLYRSPLFDRLKTDPIQLYVRSLVQAFILSLVIGAMAVPMIEAVSGMPLGAGWLFEILPRWLAYGSYGLYYCMLFFLALSCISLYASIQILLLLDQSVTPGLSEKYLWFRRVFYFLALSFSVYHAQLSLRGWNGQLLLLRYDFVLLDLIVPFIGLLILILALLLTRSSDRRAVFSQQKVFYHNDVFFKIWSWAVHFVTPLAIVMAWLLVIFGLFIRS